MKILRLTIHNIASIADAEIDFAKGVLDSESIFLICGETGAGKSTILDAIALALYKNTPRLKRTNKEKYQSDDDISTDDPRQLMRRNTAEAWVNVDFIGNNERRYTATWSVARARRKVTGNLGKVVWTLQCHEPDITYDRDADIRAEIALCIGLTFDQFCRTTMLAQGEFTRFLQSNEDEKSDILEKLTGTGIYSRIGQRIFEEARDRKTAYETQRQIIESYKLLTEDEISELTKKKHDLKSQTECLKVSRKQMADVRNWIIRRAEIEKEIGAKVSEKERLQVILQSEETALSRQRLDWWSRSTAAREAVNTIDVQREIRTDFENKISKLCARYGSLNLAKGCLGKLIEEATVGIREVDEYMTGIEPQRKMIELIPAINAHLKSSEDAGSVAKSHRCKAEKFAPEIERAKTAVEKAEAAVAGWRKKISEKQSEISETTKELGKYNLSELQATASRLNERARNIDAAVATLKQLKSQREILSTTEREMAGVESKLKDVSTRLPIQKEKLEVAEGKEQEYAELYDRQRESVGDYAKALRHSLHLGDRCPVCGAVVDKIESDEQFDAALRPIKEALEEAKKQTKKEREEYAALQASKVALSTVEKQTLSNLTNQKTEVKRLSDELGVCCEQIGIDMSRDYYENVIAEMKEQTRREIVDADATIKRYEAVSNTVHELQNAYGKLQEQERKADENLVHSRESHAKLILEKEAEIKLSENEQLRYENERNIALEQIVLDGCESMSNTEIITVLRGVEKEYGEMKLRYDDLQTKLTSYRKTVAEIESSLTEIDGYFPKWSECESVGEADLDDISNKAVALRQEAVALAAQISRNNEILSEAQNTLTAFYSENEDMDERRLRELIDFGEDKIMEIKQRLDALSEQEIKVRTSVDTLVGTLAAHDEHRPDISADDNVETLGLRIEQADKSIEEMLTEAGAIAGRIKADEQTRKEVAEQAEKVEILRREYDKWQRLNSTFGDAQGKTFRKVAQSYVLDELLHNANYFLSRLHRRYELSCSSGSLAILIRDMYQGGVVRPASTLSGGESFIVSLALALGLSTLNHDGLAVDTLFIDEGFGTLSPECLDTVVDTLQRLHELGGRKVGIISHVEELRRRIHAQIRVISAGSISTVEVVRG